MKSDSRQRLFEMMGKLEPNFDINAKMNAYLQKQYHQRAVSGVPPVGQQ